MKKNQTKNTKDFYSFKNYKPNRNAKPVVYNGTEYLSKAQCMALEGITRKELDAYLNGEPVQEEVEKETVASATEEEMVESNNRNEDLVNLEDLL